MGTTTDRGRADADIVLTFVGAELPGRFLDAFLDSELVDATDELAALLEFRRQFERCRDDVD